MPAVGIPTANVPKYLKKRALWARAIIHCYWTFIMVRVNRVV